MPDGGDTLFVRTVAAISDVGRETWEALANPQGRPYSPFVSYDFLEALETSGSVGAGTGWSPAHATLYEGDRIVGAAPLYLKAHSLGEYVFDHHWADAFERAGGRYYPKLLCAVPFTPATGPRLLAPDGCRGALARGLVELVRATGASSLHANFLTEDDAALLEEAGALARRDVQFHWFNRGYRSYGEFLAALSSRKRKALRKERAAAAEGLTIRRLIGGDITERHWDAFWTFYQDTGARKWGRPYLTREFFRRVGERMAERVLLVLAERDGTPIGGALNFIGGDALYGRYWGCTETRPFLHFELCYHQAIEAAIELGLARVEAGAQGDHKLARGYEPVGTRSAHVIKDAAFAGAIGRYLRLECGEIDAQIAAAQEASPYRKDA
jgi:hypothetical protein